MNEPKLFRSGGNGSSSSSENDNKKAFTQSFALPFDRDAARKPHSKDKVLLSRKHAETKLHIPRPDQESQGAKTEKSTPWSEHRKARKKDLVVHHLVPSRKNTPTFAIANARSNKSVSPHTNDLGITKVKSTKTRKAQHQMSQKSSLYLKELNGNISRKGAPIQNVTRLVSSDYSDGPDLGVNPIAGYDLKPPVTLRDSLRPLLDIIPDLIEHMDRSYEFIKEKATDEKIKKAPDSFAAVNLYTQEWDPQDKSLYFILNSLLRDTTMDRNEKYAKLKPFHSYLNLLMSGLRELSKFTGKLYRGLNIDLSSVYQPDTIHIWWAMTSCTDTVSGLSDFINKEGPRTILDITTVRGVKISDFSFYPSESEIVLLPGTCLKVVDQLDLGNQLVAIQLIEIPSHHEICNALFGEEEAISFWRELGGDKFSVPLEDFCDGIFHRLRIPLVKNLNNQKLNTHAELEAYQKYWALWYFSGGDDKTFKETLDLSKSDNKIENGNMITFDRFGLLLAWFGHFGKFLNEIFISAQKKYFFDDSTTSITTASLLKKSASCYVSSKDAWLIRCAPKRDYPFTISYFADNQSNNNTLINHQRIYFNPSTRQFSFTHQSTKKCIVKDSITSLMDDIIIQYGFGKGVTNIKMEPLFNNPLSQDQTNLYIT